MTYTHKTLEQLEKEFNNEELTREKIILLTAQYHSYFETGGRSYAN